MRRTLAGAIVGTSALVPDTIPADEHLTAASQLAHLAGSMQGEHQRLTIDAAKAEVAMGLRALGERRLTRSPLSALTLESARAR